MLTVRLSLEALRFLEELKFARIWESGVVALEFAFIFLVLPVCLCLCLLAVSKMRLCHTVKAI